VHLDELTCGGYSGKVIAVDFSPTAAFLASSGGMSCTIWDFSVSPAGSIPSVTVGHEAAITCQTWLTDRFMVTGGKDGTVLGYDIRFARPGRPKLCVPLMEACVEGDEVTAVAAAAAEEDGRMLLVGYVSGMVRGWKLSLEL
jgi:WD40 repeat protein